MKGGTAARGFVLTFPPLEQKNKNIFTFHCRKGEKSIDEEDTRGADEKHAGVCILQQETLNEKSDCSHLDL